MTIQNAIDLGMGINDLAPNTILAGGAVRDAINSKPIKDYDFFINSVYKKKVLGELMSTRARDDTYYHRDYEVWQPIAYSNAQLIFVPDIPIYYISEKFDIWLCLAAIEFDKGIVTRMARFNQDMENKTITVDAERYIDGTRHLTRIQEKYPDHEIVVHNKGHTSKYLADEILDICKKEVEMELHK